MVRTVLLLIIIVALALLVLFNLAPVSLTFLGITVSAPLGVWVVAAILAGALTTLMMAGLLRLARPPSSRRFTKPNNPNRFSERFSGQASAAPWSAWTNRSNPQATTSARTNTDSSRTQSQDGGWGDQPSNEEWDDWDAQPAKPRYGPETIRDREDEDWANWEGYEDVGEVRDQPLDRGRNEHDRNDFDELDDFGELDEDDSTPPRRTDFETPQQPESYRQSGSVYSYRYRKPVDETVVPPAKPGEVYDADYRVITPPYHPDPEEVVSTNYPEPPNSELIAEEDDEDWGLDEDSDDEDTDIDRPE